MQSIFVHSLKCPPSFKKIMENLFNPFVHSSLHGGYFMIKLWISITAVQIEIFKFSKDPVLFIVLTLKCVFFIHDFLAK